jgi:hypothetical protein
MAHTAQPRPRPRSRYIDVVTTWSDGTTEINTFADAQVANRCYANYQAEADAPSDAQAVRGWGRYVTAVTITGQ